MMIEKERQNEVVNELSKMLMAKKGLTNFDLIKICESKRIRTIDKKKDSHIVHELLEVAVNHFFVENYEQNSLKNSVVIEEILKGLTKLENRLTPQSWRGEEKIKLQQFSTPPTIAFLMTAILNPQKNELILEPSAGTGSLAVWLRINGCRVHLNELSETRRILLGLQGFISTACNAEFLDDLLPEEICPDVILMNPPFSANAGRTKSGDSNFGFRHITSALQRLKRGGRLVALFGTDALTKTQKGFKFLSDLSENFDLRAIIHLPKNAYYKYGTRLPVSILCIVKCEPQKPLNEVLKINCPNLEDVLSNAKIFD